jgi:hypothetical protein
MNSDELDFDNLADFELEFAVDHIIDQFGFYNVIKELEKRAMNENVDFFQGKIDAQSRKGE